MPPPWAPSETGITIFADAQTGLSSSWVPAGPITPATWYPAWATSYGTYGDNGFELLEDVYMDAYYGTGPGGGVAYAFSVNGGTPSNPALPINTVYTAGTTFELYVKNISGSTSTGGSGTAGIDSEYGWSVGDPPGVYLGSIAIATTSGTPPTLYTPTGVDRFADIADTVTVAANTWTAAPSVFDNFGGASGLGVWFSLTSTGIVLTKECHVEVCDMTFSSNFGAFTVNGASPTVGAANEEVPFGWYASGTTFDLWGRKGTAGTTTPEALVTVDAYY